ncbi:hypothetical protein ACHHYP_10374 [Achlya hypogyna]|uniref:N-acetyltransferase domain-containing protein n=1 Tax=Achlya hypogyna TaxID=1202772 RepID=A0A1V9YLL3_ACHHY|nr:hypothetical protein ACHHYP_10374 [Achlya hypogyna]
MIHEIADASTFLATIAPLMTADLEGMQLIGTVAPMTGNRFWVVVDAKGSASACALVSQRGLIMCPSITPDDANALGVKLATDVAEVLPEARGSYETLPAFIKGYTSVRPTVTVTPHHHLIIYALDAAGLPKEASAIGGRAVSGTMVAATAEDKALLVDFVTQFLIDVGEDSTPAMVETSIESQLTRGSLYLWKVRGRAVACAGHSAPVVAPDGASMLYRIMSVYTPEADRCNGYASALTAAICHNLLKSTNGPTPRVMLFADSTNAASNKAYKRIGFVSKSEMVTSKLA